MIVLVREAALPLFERQSVGEIGESASGFVLDVATAQISDRAAFPSFVGNAIVRRECTVYAISFPCCPIILGLIFDHL